MNPPIMVFKFELQYLQDMVAKKEQQGKKIQELYHKMASVQSVHRFIEFFLEILTAKFIKSKFCRTGKLLSVPVTT